MGFLLLIVVAYLLWRFQAHPMVWAGFWGFVILALMSSRM